MSKLHFRVDVLTLSVKKYFHLFPEIFVFLKNGTNWLFFFSSSPRKLYNFAYKLPEIQAELHCINYLHRCAWIFLRYFLIFILYVMLVGAQSIYTTEFKTRVYFYINYPLSSWFCHLKKAVSGSWKVGFSLFWFLLVQKMGLFAHLVIGCRPLHWLKCYSCAFAAALL